VVRQRGFTFIEVMVTLVIVALCATAVAWSLAPAADRARLTDALDRLHQFDAASRHSARRSGRSLAMHFDLGAQQWRTTPMAGGDSDAMRDARAVHRMSTGYRLTGIRTADEMVSFGKLAIPCSPQGRTPTYALRIEADTTSEATWILVAGISGQLEIVHDPWDIETIFGHLANDAAAGSF
jgi:type II secretion system protein H